MELNTKDLILREYTLLDFEAVHSYGNDPEVLKYMLWGPNSISDTKNFIMVSMLQSLQEKRDEIGLAIVEKTTGFCIGGVSLIIKKQDAEIGWILNRTSWGKGFAKQAALALLEFGFNKLKLRRIEATCDTENIRSYQLMERLGMKRMALEKGVRPSRVPNLPPSDQYRYEIDQQGYQKYLLGGQDGRTI
jgi:ribosomal-protein-alanine N-acetyltransferase